MTAAARQPRFAQGVDERPDAEFLPIRKAARLLGKTEGALRVECIRRLSERGLARQVRSRDSGRMTWHIHRSFDRRLMIEAGAKLAADGTAQVLLAATQQQRDIAACKMRVLIAYRELIAGSERVSDAIDSFIAEKSMGLELRLSRRTLQRWSSEAPPSDQRDRMMAYFIDNRGGDRRSVKADGSRGCSDEAWAEFERLYLAMPAQSIAKCHRLVAALAKQHGWQWPSKRWVAKLIEKRLDPSRICMAREGEKVWDQKFGLKLEQHPEAYAAGEVWIGDHSTLDFFARVMRGGKWRAVRLQVTAWQDWRTRLIAGWHISEQGNGDTIRYALHDGMNRLSHVPTRVWIDNGKDYDSEANTGISKAKRRKLTAAGQDWREHFTEENGGLLAMLNIDCHFARPFNHDGKSRLERFFGTMHGEFCKDFASYCGSKPGSVEPHGLPVEQLPRIDEVREHFGKFIEWYHARVDHEMKDMRDDEMRKLSPEEAWRTWLATRTIMPAPEVMALLLKRWAHPKLVSQLGIGLDFGTGQKTYYGAGLPQLVSFQGRRKGDDAILHVTYDPEDVSEIYVYDAQFRFLCIAPVNNLYGGTGPVSRQAVLEGHRLKRDHKRAAKAYLSGGRLALMSSIDAAREAQRDIDDDRRKSRQREGIAPDAEPNSMRLVRTPVDEALPAVQRAEMRKAAGAEHVNPDDEFKMPRLKRAEQSRQEEDDDDFEVRLTAPPARREQEEEEFDIWEGLKR
ncbi:MAG: DDE-type integrase/transposase/recombinase [Phycisphaerales bacterium]|nr:DDE-type integrase/transposase/recombinase [Phycisphaerales bacterium]